MKFFNLDLHISVIADIKHIFRALGHSVENWSISGHAHLMGRPTDQVKVVNQHTWRQLDSDMIEAFYNCYKSDLEEYDGFIVTHTPCFALLYEKFNKPIITVASTRYEDPFSNDMIKWSKFNRYLQQQIDKELIIPVANNKYDKKYTELFTQRDWQHIPSLCEYTDAQYTGTGDHFLYSSKFKPQIRIANLIDKEQALSQGYTWQQLADYKGIVHIPYNVSTMSIFEQYTANIPLFFPSWGLLYELREKYTHHGVLSETSWNQIHRLSSNSVLFPGIKDPNNFNNNADMMDWARLSDFYDEDNMPYIQYFDSFEHLGKLLQTVDLNAISKNMKEHNKKRKEKVYESWKEILSRIEQ
tara:strand:+ start:734 stop:1801 length:1068 start_codon:yes stop_codon:yes gene_type:complete